MENTIFFISWNYHKLYFQGRIGVLFAMIDTTIITFVPYIIIIVYSIKVRNHIKRHQSSFSADSRRIQSDLTKVMAIQAIIPMFTAFLPLTLLLISGVVNTNLALETFLSSILYSWIPTGNAISIIFFVTSYRKKLKQLIIDLKSKIFCTKPQPIIVGILTDSQQYF